MLEIQEPAWCGDASRRMRLTQELSNLLDEVGSLCRTAQHNAKAAESGEACRVEPGLKVPPLVRRLAADYERLREAIDGCKTLAMLDDVLGKPGMFRTGPKPEKDREHIVELVETSRHLHDVVQECYQHFDGEPSQGGLDPQDMAKYLESRRGQADRFLYEMRLSGSSNPQTLEEFGKVFSDHRWEAVTTTQGVRNAVNRYRRNTGAKALPETATRGGAPKKPPNPKGKTAK